MLYLHLASNVTPGQVEGMPHFEHLTGELFTVLLVFSPKYTTHLLNPLYFNITETVQKNYDKYKNKLKKKYKPNHSEIKKRKN